LGVWLAMSPQSMLQLNHLGVVNTQSIPGKVRFLVENCSLDCQMLCCSYLGAGGLRPFCQVNLGWKIFRIGHKNKPTEVDQLGIIDHPPCLFVCLFACLFVCLLVCLFVYLFFKRKSIFCRQVRGFRIIPRHPAEHAETARV